MNNTSSENETNGPRIPEMRLGSNPAIPFGTKERTAEMIINSRALKKLYIRDLQRFDEKFYKCMFEAIGLNKTIETLILSGFRNTQAFKNHMENSFRLNDSIKSLDIWVSESEDVEFLSVLPKNLVNLFIAFPKEAKFRIKEFCESLNSHVFLSKLTLYNLNGNSELFHCLADTLEKNTKIKHLKLRDDKMNEGWEILFDGLMNNTTIQTIELSMCRLSSKRIISKMAEFLHKNRFLETLILDTCPFTMEGCMVLWSAIRKSECLLELDIWSRIKYFKELLNPPKNLVKLKPIGFEFSEKNLKDVLNGLSKNKTLKTLELVNVALPSKIMKLFGDFLAQDSKCGVTELILKNHFADEVYITKKQFFQNLMKNKSLKHLKMDGAPTKDAADFIGELLKENNSLELLEMWRAPIDAEQSKSIFEALKTNSTLTYLAFNNNSFGNIAVPALVEMLEHNKSLKTILISPHDVSFEGLKLIFESIGKNTTITEFGFNRGVALNHNQWKELHSHFKRNQSITDLNETFREFEGTMTWDWNFHHRICANSDFNKSQDLMNQTFVSHQLGDFFQDVMLNFFEHEK